jgi:hypothetical protein
MAVFDESFNYDDVFLRDVTLGLIKEFYREVRWINVWKDQKKLVTVPFFYANIGDERFLLDAFVDDVPGKRPELNYDQIPRGVITLDNWGIKTGEFTNPNVPFYTYEEKNGELRKVVGKYKPLPLKFNYSIEILLGTEIDIWKCSQSIWDFFYKYKFFHIEYKSIRVDCNMYIPDAEQVEMQRQIDGLSGETDKKITFDVEVNTFYPIPPKESKSIPINRRVVVRGNLKTLGSKGRKRVWIGNDANKKK